MSTSICWLFVGTPPNYFATCCKFKKTYVVCENFTYKEKILCILNSRIIISNHYVKEQSACGFEVIGKQYSFRGATHHFLNVFQPCGHCKTLRNISKHNEALQDTKRYCNALQGIETYCQAVKFIHNAKHCEIF